MLTARPLSCSAFDSGEPQLNILGASTDAAMLKAHIQPEGRYNQLPPSPNLGPQPKVADGPDLEAIAPYRVLFFLLPLTIKPKP